MIKVALTGHRPQRLNLPDDEMNIKWNKIGQWINDTIISLMNKNGKIIAYCGMADGCDIKFGLITGVTNNTELHCIMPCKNYNSNHQYYNLLKRQSDEWIELADEFYRGCDNVRDQYMVDNCDVLLAIWDGNKSGGVWSTIRKAQKAGKEIIYIPIELLQ